MKRMFALLCTFAFILAAVPSFAAEAEKESWLPGPAPKISAEVETMSPASVDGGGEFSFIRSRVAASVSYFTLAYERRTYSWSDTAKLDFGDGGDPIDELHRLTFSGRYNDMITQNWGYFVGGAVASAFEETMADSWSFNGYAGATYAFNRDWQIQLGAVGLFHDVRSRALPYVGLNWRARAKEGFSASLGFPFTRLNYHFTPKLTGFLNVSYDNILARLRDDSPIQAEGYLETNSYRGSLGLSYNIIAGLDITGGVRGYFGRELTTYDRDGNEVDNLDVDPAIGAYLEVSYKF